MEQIGLAFIVMAAFVYLFDDEFKYSHIIQKIFRYDKKRTGEIHQAETTKSEVAHSKKIRP